MSGFVMLSLQDKEVGYLLGSANCAAPAEIRNEAGVNSSGGSSGGGSGTKKRNNDGTLKKADEALDKISNTVSSMVESQKFLGDILKQMANNNSSTTPASAALIRTTQPAESELELMQQLEKVNKSLNDIKTNGAYSKDQKKILKKSFKKVQKKIIEKLEALLDDDNDNNSSSEDSE